jgi:hypothetical protein
VYRNFQRLCRNLDDHKKVLSIFPQQSLYASVFCGSISLIIQVSFANQIPTRMSNEFRSIKIHSQGKKLEWALHYYPIWALNRIALWISDPAHDLALK